MTDHCRWIRQDGDQPDCNFQSFCRCGWEGPWMPRKFLAEAKYSDHLKKEA